MPLSFCDYALSKGFIWNFIKPSQDCIYLLSHNTSFLYSIAFPLCYMKPSLKRTQYAQLLIAAFTVMALPLTNFTSSVKHCLACRLTCPVEVSSI